MEMDFVTLTQENLDREQLCCIVRTKKPHPGVERKRAWLRERIREGHVFRKLAGNDCAFIEYAPIETAWAPVEGADYLYLYCLWVQGAPRGQGVGKALMESCLQDARAKGKAGVCMLGAEKQKAWLSDQAFAAKFGFVPVDVSGIAGAPLSRSDAERRFVSQSASLIKAGAESLGLEVAGNTRGYRLEGMIEGASELRLTLVSPALGCPAPKEAAAAPNAQTAGQMSAGRRTPSQVNPAPARPPEVRCIAKLRLATLDEDASPAVRLPGWLASSGVDATGSETAVWRFGEGANLTFALPSTAKLTAQELYRAIAVTLPEGWAIYLPPRAVETPNSGELLFRAPLLLEAAGENKFVAP